MRRQIERTQVTERLKPVVAAWNTSAVATSLSAPEGDQRLSLQVRKWPFPAVERLEHPDPFRFHSPRVVSVQRASTDLQSFRVTQLPDQPSAPVTDRRPLAKSEHLRDPPLQRSAAPAPGLPDIDDECIVNPLIVKPRDRDIGILSLEMSAGPRSKELGRGGVISHKQVDPRTPRNCRSTSCAKLSDGFKTIETRITQSVNGGQGKWIDYCIHHRSCSRPVCRSAPEASQADPLCDNSSTEDRSPLLWMPSGRYGDVDFPLNGAGAI